MSTLLAAFPVLARFITPRGRNEGELLRDAIAEANAHRKAGRDALQQSFRVSLKEYTRLRESAEPGSFVCLDYPGQRLTIAGLLVERV